jgi:hypothetical protein
LVSSSSCNVFGADYTPMTTTRILDTRYADGVKTKTPIPAHGTLTVPVPAVGSLPAAAISALVLNLTVTGPTSAGSLTAYSAGDPVPGVSSLNFSAHRTTSNLVVVPLTTGVSIHNSSAGTVHVIADLEGYYSASGSGFKPTTPVRVLDTGKGTGAAAHPVAAHGTVNLNLSPRVPVTATAVVLTVTVTAPTAAGTVTGYPSGKPIPAMANLHFVAKNAASNLVMVPVSAGHVSFYNNSAGTLQLAADLGGYFGGVASGATQTFVPYGPVRIMDTRTPGQDYSTPVPAHGRAVVNPSFFFGMCVPTCPLPTASVLNVAVTQAKAGGVVIAYPSGISAPAARTVSFIAGQAVSTLATVSSSPGFQTYFYNNSAGTVQIIVDDLGYYIAAG